MPIPPSGSRKPSLTRRGEQITWCCSAILRPQSPVILLLASQKREELSQLRAEFAGFMMWLDS
jgi:hypothetical protein